MLSFFGFNLSKRKSPINRKFSKFNASEKDEQETNNSLPSPLGSSETTREACSNLDFSDYYKYGTPDHKKTNQKPSPEFLAWFIGFFEADGNFQTYTKIQDGIQQNTGRFGFSIDQEDPTVIHRIKKELGFGIAYDVCRDGKTYWRYNTTSLQNIFRLVYLLNGNLVLDKRREQFNAWVTAINKTRHQNIVLKPSRCVPNLKDAWLSGFIQGDGGFWTNISNGFRKGFFKNGNIRYAFIVKFYITQDEEERVLLAIRDLLKATSKISTITNGRTKKKYFRFETTAFQPREIITKYLTTFPMYGQKNIEYKRWVRINDYFNAKYPLTEKSAQKLLRLLETLEEPSSDETVLTDPSEND